MRGLIAVAMLALSACATTPGPVQVRTVEVVKPIPVPCVRPDQIPAMPAKVGDQLTGDPVADVSVLAASNLRLRAAMGKALALLGACSTLN
jgi:hypothetical protein